MGEDGLGELLVIPTAPVELAGCRQSTETKTLFEGVSLGAVCVFASVERRRRERGVQTTTAWSSTSIAGSKFGRILRRMTDHACRWHREAGLEDNGIWVLRSLQFLPESLGSRSWPASERIQRYLRSIRVLVEVVRF